VRDRLHTALVNRRARAGRGARESARAADHFPSQQMPITVNTERWIVRPQPNPATTLRLFCFPYAGGGTTVFQSWAKQLSAHIEVCAVQLNGRGARFRETPFTRLRPLVQAAAQGLAPHFDKPFAFFGHSMGALIAFELTRLLRREGLPLPLRLFVSGCKAPHLPPHAPMYDLPEPELIAELKRLNGTPREVFENPDLLKMVLPLIRADFAVCQTYRYADEPPLPLPLTAFGSLLDAESTHDDISQWRRHTSSTFSQWMLPGDHFFIHTCLPQLLTIVAQELSQFLCAA
jgi:medium-chain acyl-[acyl-carrier-protein] hydrolase